jgi:hypothetical protein
MWFKRKPFHQTRQWRRLAKAHKILHCECGSTKDIESCHYLPQKRFPMMRLWKVNLYHGCSDCNGKLGNRIKWSIRAIQLLVIYGAVYIMTKVLGAIILIAVFALCLTVTFKDFYYGGMEASITGQTLIDTWELLKGLLASMPIEPIGRE